MCVCIMDVWMCAHHSTHREVKDNVEYLVLSFLAHGFMHAKHITYWPILKSVCHVTKPPVLVISVLRKLGQKIMTSRAVWATEWVSKHPEAPCMHTYLHTHVHAHIHVHTHKNTLTQTNTHTHMHTYTRIYSHWLAYIYTSILTHKYILTQIHTHTQTHRLTHRFTHRHIHTHS